MRDYRLNITLKLNPDIPGRSVVYSDFFSFIIKACDSNMRRYRKNGSWVHFNSFKSPADPWVSSIFVFTNPCYRNIGYLKLYYDQNELKVVFFPKNKYFFPPSIHILCLFSEFVSFLNKKFPNFLIAVSYNNFYNHV